MAVLLSGFRSKKNQQRQIPQVFRWKKPAAENAVPISDQRQAVALPLGFWLKKTCFPFPDWKQTSSTRPKAQTAPISRVVPLSELTDNFLDGTSSVYFEELQQAWEQDPNSVDESWDNFFRSFVGQATISPGIFGQTIQESMNLLLLVRAYQVNGHMKAKLDPLSLEERQIPDDIDPASYGFTKADLDREFFLGVWSLSGFLSKNSPVQTLRAILTRLEKAYCGSIGYEYMHISDREKCNWLRDKIETPTTTEYSHERCVVMLDRLMWSSLFENFLATKWTATKRFSLEGCETLIPGMEEMFDKAADLGVESIVIGMSHRGRLNVLGNVVRKSLRQIFNEFSGGTNAVGEAGYVGTGDLRYHLGASYDRPTRGQGVVYETLHLSALPNYTTGGTIHIVVNNQVAFTTDPRSGRSSQYCTDVAKALSAPIFHVNGDDVEAVAHVCELAAEWRQTFHSDVVVDIVCYRRFGHNENDEPFFTQPKMYKVIRNHPSALEIYQKKLLDAGNVGKDDIEKMHNKINAVLNEEFVACKDYAAQKRDWLSAFWSGFKSPEQLSHIRNTGAVKRIFDDHKKMIETGEGVDWALGEALAFATLLVEGNHVRLSGQDVERGTFSHRHSVLHDQETGEKYCPMDHVMMNQNEEMFTVSNSSLSEFGVLGFELGYSMENPNSLVIWEAQYGEFSMGAQVIFDQFLSSGEAKWLRQTGLVVLLPHGYDGQGPEHSNARLERFLQMSDDNPYVIPEMDSTRRTQIQECNWQVVNVTTPANYFHVLRRQDWRVQIEKFNGTDFAWWKMQIEALLGECDLDMVQEEKPDGMDKAAEAIWDSKDENARALSNMYEKPSAGNRVFLMRELFMMRMNEGCPVADHINEVNLILSSCPGASFHAMHSGEAMVNLKKGDFGKV
ncbi:unnamed protein product [Cuscuta campestris]|uniref:2-oxoglutarate dehydrogenase, mitochondrial n=1 Tax=Cuscuta campestris TaxID=132261 RepID=A0A484LY90_9ASTE|nr:unnamed protein product [Cuscuta campestris]